MVFKNPYGEKPIDPIGPLREPKLNPEIDRLIFAFMTVSGIAIASFYGVGFLKVIF